MLEKKNKKKYCNCYFAIVRKKELRLLCFCLFSSKTRAHDIMIRDGHLPKFALRIAAHRSIFAHITQIIHIILHFPHPDGYPYRPNHVEIMSTVFDSKSSEGHKKLSRVRVHILTLINSPVFFFIGSKLNVIPSRQELFPSILWLNQK